MDKLIFQNLLPSDGNEQVKLKKPYQQPAVTVMRFQFSTAVLSSSSNDVDNGYGNFDDLGSGEEEEF